MRLALPTRLSTSIQAKISAAVIAAVLAAVGLTALTSALREADRTFQSKRAELDGIASALSASVANALAERKTADVGRTLSAIRSIPDVTFAQVLDAKGASVIQLGNSVVLERPGQRVTPNSEIGVFSGLLLRNYMIETPIVSSGERIGTLRIIANISALENALAQSLLSALLAGALAAAFGLLLAQRLQHSITAPIKGLTGAMGDIRGSQDYARPVQRLSDDETGLMVDAFNDMLGQIRARDQRLAEHRDRLEIEVEERTSELKAATQAAQSANAAKSEFPATMSHEIRTPLNGMLVMAELISTGNLPDRLQRHADVIVSSGQSLLAIINDILDLSKIEAGRLELEMLPVEPAIVADQVMSLFAARAAGKGVDLACYVAPTVPSRIAADPVRLNQVLANLVNNALKFTEAGSVTLRVDCDGTPVLGEPCRLRFSVTDTGIGIEEDKLKSIFDPFTQADQSTTRRFGGTGIGLSISKKLVAAMGGEIAVASEAGKGSTFSFTITTEAIELRPARPEAGASGCALIVLPPYATRNVLAGMLRDIGWETMETDALPASWPSGIGLVAVDPAAAAALAARQYMEQRPRTILLAHVGDVMAGTLIDDGHVDALLVRPLSRRDLEAALAHDSSGAAKGPRRRAGDAAALPAFPGIHVLAADDNAVNREVVAEALARLGVKLTMVEDGEAAVKAAASRDFDLVLMDCSMPVMDGYAATRAIRKAESAAGKASVPIIALTAHVAGMHAGAWREAGMNDTLSKPFTFKGLAAALERWIDPARRNPGIATETEPPLAEENAHGGEPLLSLDVIELIREMQSPGDDLVGRIIGLYRLHAPPALERLEAALATGDMTPVAETTHALKSLCRNIGAIRLGNLLHEIETGARGGFVDRAREMPTRLRSELADVLRALGAIETQSTPGAIRRVQ